MRKLLPVVLFSLLAFACEAKAPKGCPCNGLLPAAIPTVNVPPGTYLGPQNVTVSTATVGGTTRCTLDGSTPNSLTPACSTPEVITGATTPECLQAITTAVGYNQSLPGSWCYTITTQAQMPTYSPVPGTYVGSIFVSLNCASPAPSILYTVDGSSPTSPPTGTTTTYSSAISVLAPGLTIKAICTSAGLATSGTATGIYKITNPGALSIATLAALPAATIGTPYTTSMVASGGTPPYTWSAISNTTTYSSDQKAANGVFVAPTPQNTWALSTGGALTSTPAGAEIDYFLIKVTDNVGATASGYFAASVGSSTNRITITNPVSLGNVAQGTVFTSASPLSVVNAVGGQASFTYSLVSQTGTNGWAVASNGAITGTATNEEVDTLSVQATDGINTRTATLAVTVSDCVSSCARPAGNTGAGFFVTNGELYDANGNLFRPRGWNRSHYDDSAPGSSTGANTVRYTLYYTGVTEAQLVSDFTTQHTNLGQFVISSRHYDDAGGTSSGSTNLGLQTGKNASGLGRMVTDWVNAFPAYNTAIMNKVAINIANEWGPDTAHVGGGVIQYLYGYQAVSCTGSVTTIHVFTCSTVSGANPFANAQLLTIAYLAGSPGNTNAIIPITAIGGSSGAWTVTTSATLTVSSGGTLWGGAVGILRGVGYTCPLMIDAGQYGQGYTSLTNYSAAIYTSDPQKNVLFDYHLYGGTTALSTLTSAFTTWNALREANGMDFMIGEVGGYKIPSSGSSITQFPTPELLQTFENYDFGYTWWALDNYATYSGTSSKSDDNSFAMKYQDADPNGYPSNKNQYGKYTQLDPVLGMQVNATLATSLNGVTTLLSMPNYADLYGNTYVSGANGAISPTRGQTQIAPKNLPPGALYPLAERANPYAGAGHDTYYWPNTWAGAGTMTGFSPANAAGHSQLSIQPQGNSPTTTFQLEGPQFGAYMLGSDASGSSGRPQFTLQQNFGDNPVSGQPAPGPVLFTGSTVVLHNSITLACPTWVGAASAPNTTNSPYIQVGLGLIPTPVPTPRSWELDIFINVLAGSAENQAVHSFFLTQGPPDSYSIVIPFGASPGTYVTYNSGTYQTGSFSTPITFSWSISYAQMQAIIAYMIGKGFTAFNGMVPEDFTLFQAHINAEQPNISTISMGWNVTNWEMTSVN